MGDLHALEEVDDRRRRLCSSDVRGKAQVHRLLHTVGAQQRNTGAPDSINIAVVGIDGDPVGGHSARCQVHDQWEALPGHLVEDRHHEQQPLGARVRAGQRTCLKRPVQRTCNPGLGLHLADYDRLP